MSGSNGGCSTGLPAAFIRKKPKSYGTCQYVEGTPLKGRSFVLVEDVVSSGGALIDTLSMLKADELWPRSALCVIDRESGGQEALAGVGPELKSLFTYSQIVDYQKSFPINNVYGRVQRSSITLATRIRFSFARKSQTSHSTRGAADFQAPWLGLT
jgi:orotate phosphoribosyltransferase